MFPGINPKKMQAMMKQMGIAQQEIDANRVIIECDDKDIIINNPSVVKINMQGQENFQISGDISEVEKEGQGDSEEESEEGPEEDKTEEDVKTIMEKCSCLEEEARLALEKANGDLTEALLELS
ncbi:MAG: nascent polypeptide-associated complex protein [archaeon]